MLIYQRVNTQVAIMIISESGTAAKAVQCAGFKPANSKRSVPTSTTRHEHYHYASTVHPLCIVFISLAKKYTNLEKRVCEEFRSGLGTYIFTKALSRFPWAPLTSHQTAFASA